MHFAEALPRESGTCTVQLSDPKFSKLKHTMSYQINQFITMIRLVKTKVMLFRYVPQFVPFHGSQTMT